MSPSASPSEAPSPSRERRRGAKRSPGRRLLRWSLVVLAVLLALPLLLLAFLETGPGRRLLVSLIEDFGSGPGMEIAIGGSEGGPLDRLTLTQVTLSDERGAWLRADELILDWNPSALFGGRLEVELLRVGTLALERLPPPGPETTETTDSGGLPELPFAIEVASLEIGSIDLAEAVLGIPARLRLDAAAAADADTARLDLALTREDAEGFLKADLLWNRADERLSLDLTAQEPRGGLATRLMALPELPSLDLALQGEGSLADWQGRLDMQLAGEEALSGRVTVRGEQARDFTLALDLRPPALEVAEGLASLPELQPLLPGGVSLTAEGRLEGETLDLAVLTVSGEVIDLEAAGSLDLAAEAADLSFDLALEDGAAIGGLLPSPTLAAASLTGTLSGPFAAPTLSLEAVVERPEMAEAALDRLRLSLSAEPLGADALGADGFSLALDAGLVGPRLLLPDLPPWPYGDTTVSARLDLFPADGSATLHELSLSGEELALSAEGELALPALAGELLLALDARLPPLPELGSQPPRLTLDGRLSGEDLAAAVEGELAASLIGTESLPEGLGALLGPRVDLAGGFSYADGRIALAAASLLVEQFALDLDGTLAPDKLDVTWRLAVEELEAAMAPLEIPAAGSLVVSGSALGDPGDSLAVEADIDGEALAFEGTQIGPLSGSISFAGLPAAPVGSVSLSAPQSAYGPIAVDAEAVAQEEGGYRVEPLSVALGDELVLQGSLAGETAGLPLTGQLAGTLEAGPLLQALGLPLQGSGDLAITLSAPDGRQNANVEVSLRRGSVADLGYGAIRLQAALTDLLGQPALDATASVESLDLGGGRFDRVTASAQGGLDDLAFSLQANGDLEGPTDIDLAGQLVEGGAAVRLTRLEGRVADLPLALVGQTTIGLGDPLTVAPATFELAGGRVTLEATRGGGNLALKARAEGVELQTFDPFVEGLTPGGRLDMTLDLGGSGGRATGRLDIQLADFALRRQGLSLGPAVDVAAALDIGARDATLDADIVGDFGEDLKIRGSYPVAFSLDTLEPVIDRNRQLSGSVTWQGRVAGLVDYLPLDSQELDGNLDLDLRLAGTPAAPQVSGDVLLDQGRYENLVTGTVITDLTLALRGEGSRLTIERASGGDGAGGRLDLSGGIDLAAPETAAIQLDLEDFRLLGRDDLLAVVDGDLSFSPVDGTPTFAGTLIGEQIEVDIEADLPASVPTLDVVVLRDGEPVSPETAERQVPGEQDLDGSEGAATLGPIALDIQVDLPRRVFVRGSGLDSEWAGNLSITGTVNSPIIVGSLAPQRGQFEVLGKVFTLESGSITFDGGSSIDPLLDLRAVHEADEVTAIVSVGGRASNPEISLISSPPLPEEEVLARVLFSRGTGQLSPVEAVQLAEALAAFTGVASDRPIVERLRGALGLDVLRVGGGEGDDVASATAGRYVAEDVFVGVTQGTTPGSTSATVEVELTPDIKVEGKAGQESSVGIHWEWDY